MAADPPHTFHAPDQVASQRYRLFVGTVMAAVLAMTLLWLQSLFDQGDARRARDMVLAFRPGGAAAESVGSAIQGRTGAPASCAGQVRSSCAGMVHVTCAGNPPYEFDVALVARGVIPASPAAQDLVRSVGGK